jgi:hypothetical protein
MEIAQKIFQDEKQRPSLMAEIILSPDNEGVKKTDYDK